MIGITLKRQIIQQQNTKNNQRIGYFCFYNN
jgi:hypothetical protein